jgi:hypothetical protein
MARSGIYKSEVVRARDKLLALGRHPSIDAVRVELGNTGSKATIHRFLKEIEEEEGGTTGSKVAVSEAIQDLVGRLAARLNEEADLRVNQVTAKSAEKIQQLGAATETLKSEVRTGLVQLERSQQALADEQKEHELTQGKLREVQTSNVALSQEVRDLRERLDAQELHRKSLEEKHQHARDSLEHFRQSAKEQREQEARKHGQEVLYFQGEVANANKALVTKQNEATAAHQECSRLLAELNQSNAQLHAAKEDARGLRKKDADLQHAQKMLEERGRDLVVLQALAKSHEESNLALKSQVELLTARAQQLEIQLAAATASLEAQKSVVASFAKQLGAVSRGVNSVEGSDEIGDLGKS